MGERTRELAILIMGDVFIFFFSLWITLLVRYLEWPSGELLGAHFEPFLILSTVWLFVFYITGLYDKQTLFLKSQLLSRILNVQVINGVLAVLLFFIIPFGIAPKTNLVIYLIVSAVLFSLWRIYVYRVISPKTQHRAVLLANGPESIELVDEINNNNRYTYSFVRIIDEATALKTPDFERKLLELIEKERISIIVANPDGKYLASVLPKLFDLSFLRFELSFLDFYRIYEDTFDRVPASALSYQWFINQVSQGRSIVYDAVKRSMDVAGAILLLIPTALIFPLIALAIWLEDRGRLFYSTVRIGQYNRPITIYKFRTKNGADAGADALASKLVDTRVGLFLRKTRIDELPQLINVLRGDLSFIGPRPEMPALAEVYAREIPYYNTRHFLKPGLSGWAQINNFDVPRGGIDVPRTTTKLSYDLFYLARRSLLLDIEIGLKTISTILRRTGS